MGYRQNINYKKQNVFFFYRKRIVVPVLWTISTNKAKGVVLQPPLSSSQHDIHVCAAFVLVGKRSVRLGRDA